jgi:hypothetical protein
MPRELYNTTQSSGCVQVYLPVHLPLRSLQLQAKTATGLGWSGWRGEEDCQACAVHNKAINMC